MSDAAPRRPRAHRRLFVTTALPHQRPVHRPSWVHQADIWVRFQRMQGHEVHFVCADDTHGAPIMLRADAEGVTPRELVTRIAATRPKHLAGFHLSFDHWHSTDSPENVELSQDIYRRLRDREPSLIATRSVEQFFDPVKEMFLPDRYIKGECPKCGAKDQYGDACESCGVLNAPIDLKNPYSTISGAVPVRRSSDHFFFRLSDPACVEFLQEWTLAGGALAPRLQPEVFNKAQEWLGADGKGLADWDISRDAPYFGIPIPDAPGKFFYVWLDAPRLPPTSGVFDSGKAKAASGTTRSSPSCGIAAPSRSTSSARTSSTSTRCSGRRCSSSPGRRTRCRTTSTSTASSPFPARRCRSRAAPASAPTSISTSASTRSGCATTSPPS
jgi:hypothetical protein